MNNCEDHDVYFLDRDQLKELMSLAIDVELCEHDGIVDRMKQTGKRMQELLNQAYRGNKHDDPTEGD